MYINKKFGKDIYCGITYTRLRSGTFKSGIKKTTFLSCGHGFCTNALKKWFQVSCNNNFLSCPLCRTLHYPGIMYFKQ